ncbi:MAG TPA: beta-N-acetylhexosaminidase [Candidatus Baltobacteraceae bacterium]|jgi:beta-N-acetylhexosaminidase
MNEDLRRLAAGVVCVGFDGTRMDAALESKLRDLPLAGLILFGRNIESLAQTRALTDRIRELYATASGLTPIVATDQEGGRVARLRDGVEEFPSMMALAATGDAQLARRAGEQLAFDLRRAGVNLDFAPVLDLALQRDNTAIGARSFGSDPLRVAELAGAFAQGVREAGIVPTYKHFPGHGSTAVDSHLGLPAIEEDATTLRARDLLPFKMLLPHAQAVMTAHIIFRALDGEHPATISPQILTTLLREEIGFEGVCFTDCMQMDAIAKSVGTPQGAVRALIAGADCVLISHDITLAQQAVELLLDAVADGSLSRSRLQGAYDRVASLRRSLAAPLPLDAPAPAAGIGREIGRRAVTRIRGDATADTERSIVVTFEGTTTEGVVGAHSEHASLVAAAPGLAELRAALDPPARQVTELLASLARASRRPIVVMRRAHVYANQARAVERILAAHPDTILVSAREPFDAFDFPQARTVVCTYGDDAPSIAGLADVLFGHARPEGVLPLSLPEPVEG